MTLTNVVSDEAIVGMVILGFWYRIRVWVRLLIRCHRVNQETRR